MLEHGEQFDDDSYPIPPPTEQELKELKKELYSPKQIQFHRWVRDSYIGVRDVVDPKQTRYLILAAIAQARCISDECDELDRVITVMLKLYSMQQICHTLDVLIHFACCTDYTGDMYTNLNCRDFWDDNNGNGDDDDYGDETFFPPTY